MQFKTDEVRYQWRKKGCLVNDHGKNKVIRLDPKLIDSVLILEWMAGLSKHGPTQGVCITDLISTFRKGFSLHPYGYASDIRTRDWSPIFMAAVKAVGLALHTINRHIQFVWEEDHLHIEYDDAKIKSQLMQSFDNGEVWWKN